MAPHVGNLVRSLARAALHRHLNATVAPVMILSLYAPAVFVLYALGQFSARRPSSSVESGAHEPSAPSPAGYVVRVLLVTFNAAANILALTALGLPPTLATLPILVVLGAAIPRVAENRAYTTMLAWSAPLLPTTWPASGVGLLAASLNYALGAVAGKGPVRFGFDPATCSVIVYGGPLYFFRCGYNLGNVVFIHSHFVDEAGVCSPGLIAHETGHTLNVAAFGFVFHYIGAIHENWGPPAGGAGDAAYAELWAESRRRAVGRPWIRGWAAAGSEPGPPV